MNDSMNQSLPRSPFIIFAILFVMLVLYCTLYIVRQTEMALVTQFGNPVAVEMNPGLKIKIPFIQSVEYFDKRLMQYDMPDEVEINSADEKRIRVEAFLRWRITDPLAFARATRASGGGGNRISTMDLQLSNLLGSSLRQVIGSAPLKALLSPERDHIMDEIRSIVEKQAQSSGVAPDATDANDKNGLARKNASGFGIEIVDVRIVKADLPPENQKAIFRRMETERERDAKSYRAQGEEESQRIRAHADRDRTILLADAEKKAETLKGEGDGEASKIFADAFGKDPEFFEFYRSMQAYRATLSKKDTTMVLSPDSLFLKAFGHADKH